MDRQKRILELKNKLKEAQTVDDIRGVFFTMFFEKYSEEEMAQVLEDFKLTEEIQKEMELEERKRK